MAKFVFHIIYISHNTWQSILHKKYMGQGFPGGAVVKNPPANAGDTGSSPGLGRSYMPRSNKAREPQLLSLRSRARAPQQAKPPQWEDCAPQWRVARTLQLEKAHAQQRRPNTANK